MKLFPTALLFALLTAAPQTNLYQLVVSAQGIVAVVSFNGVPMIRLDGNPQSQAAMVNAWVHRGENTVAFECSLPPGKAATSETKFNLSLAVAWRGEKGIRNQTLWIYELPKKKDGSVDVPAEETITGDTKIELPLHTTTWLDGAPKLKVDENAKRRLASNVASFHRAVMEGDAKTLERLTWWKTEETSRLGGWPMDPAQFTQRVRNLIQVLKDYRLEKLDPKTLRYDLLAGDRVVVVTREGKGSPISFSGTNGGMEIDLYYGMVSNQWMLVR
jgi:hypothetical protein